MRWRLSPLRQRRLRQLLLPQHLSSVQRRVAGLVLLLSTVAVVGHGLYSWGLAHPESQAAAAWERYATTLRPGVDGTEQEPPNMAGVTVEDSTKDGTDRQAPGGALSRDGAVTGRGRGAYVSGASSLSETDAASTVTKPQATDPLRVQPGTLFDRIYLVTDVACSARHEWINAAAAAAGVTSPIEMFPVVNASGVDLRNPPLPVADIDASKTPTVSVADVALTVTHRALWQRVFDDKHERVLVLGDTWFPSRSLLTLMPELLAAVDAAVTKERPWHVLLLTRNVAPQGEVESAWTDGRGVATLDRTVTVVPKGGVESAAGGYILSASGANALLAGLTVHRALLGTALGDVPDTTVLSACDNAHFLPGCPENGVAAPASLVDVCAAPGAVLPAAAFPSHAESERVAEPMVLPPGAAEKALTPRARR